MNHPFGHAADPQTAFMPAEGEVRSKVSFRLERLTANPAKPGPQVVGTHSWQCVWCLLQRANSTIQRPKTIQTHEYGSGLVQRAFYRQCSGEILLIPRGLYGGACR